MPDVTVNYIPLTESNLAALSPTPFVSRSFEPVEAGALRLGFVETYEIHGFLSGANSISTGYSLTANPFARFQKSPGILSINGDNVNFSKTGFITSFSIPQNNFLSSSGLFPYTVKLNVFDTLSKIKDPSFEYSFTENQDRSVGLGVKISAQGLTSIYDARVFVENLANTYHLTGFVPVYIATGANWSLRSSKKTVDRTKFTYSLEREYLCVPSGYIHSTFPFSENTKVSQKFSTYADEYPSFEFETNLKILADNTKSYQQSKSWDSFESTLFNSRSHLEYLSLHYLKRYGAANLNDFILNNISISKNSGAKEVNLKFELLSGKASDFFGHFDYSLTTEEDLSMGDKSISLNGEFVVKGDLTNKKLALEKWIKNQFTPQGIGQAMVYTSNESKLYNYVLGLTGIANGIISSSMFGVDKIKVDFNSGLAEFKLGASIDNKVRIIPGSETSFSVDVQASVPIYKFIPAANIEGHYIIQDLRCMTAETAKIEVNGKADSITNLDKFLGTGVKIVGELFNGFAKTDFAGVIKNGINYVNIFPESLSVNSGLADASFSISYGVIYSGNKNYNHSGFKATPPVGTIPAGIVLAPASQRNKHLFGR